MPPDHDHFSGRVIPVGLRRMPDRVPYLPAERARGSR